MNGMLGFGLGMLTMRLCWIWTDILDPDSSFRKGYEEGYKAAWHDMREGT